MSQNTHPEPGQFNHPDGSGSGKVRSLSTPIGGKLPPQALDMEEAVLGALLLEKDALHRIMDVLQPQMFYKDANRIIFENILELFQNSEPIDILTVKNSLRQKGELEKVGGAYYLTQLTSRVNSSANIEYHARVVAEKHILRSLISISDQVIKEAYDETTDVFELLDKAEQQLFEVSETNLRRNYLGMGELVVRTLERLEEMRGKDTSVTGIPSGMMELDKMTAGWQKTDLVIIAARPAMGKTALTLTLARNAALRFNEPVAFFSLEMAAVQLVQRLLCSEAELDAQKVRTGRLEDYEWKQLITRIGSLSKAPIYIDDTPALSIWDLRAKCRRLKAEKGISMVVIDYLQLMSGNTNKSGNREQEIASISRALKEMAKELDVCMIALSQLSRAVESRGGDKRPVLSDLRESGSIEQDADMVMFLYRPEYYGFETDEEGNSTQGLAELIIAKQRNGPTGSVKLQFIGQYGKFTDWNFSNNPGIEDVYNSFNGGGGNTITLPSKMNKDQLPPPPPPDEDPGVPF
ncbi:MAG: replicative DNA helicase [Bacteroidetes bacterium]|nr:MAG: replicative DNA helicase [Bacteroidota bacterium]